MNLKFTLLFGLSTLCTQLFAQQAPGGMETPRWVFMMEDPNVNFFEAIKEYQNYWMTHRKPISESELFEKENKRPKEERQAEAEREEERLQKLGKELSGSELEQTEYLKYQSKRFDKWVIEVKPWVQENGHILSYEERRAIWEKEEAEKRIQNEKK
ncbi:MAG: hypothetical protein ACKOQY_00255 [Bacteroidota bacterium]